MKITWQQFKNGKLKYAVACALIIGAVLIYKVFDDPQVIEHEYMTYVDGGSDFVSLNVYAKKELDCVFVPDSEQGFVFINGGWEEANFAFLEDKTPGSSNPTDPNFQYFGLWNWTHEIMHTATKVKTTVEHICDAQIEFVTHPDGTVDKNIVGHTRTTTIGPFLIKNMITSQ